jgi:hypothetical protein
MILKQDLIRGQCRALTQLSPAQSKQSGNQGTMESLSYQYP